MLVPPARSRTMRDIIQTRGLMIDDALEDLDEEDIILVLGESCRLPVVLKERLSGQRWELLKGWLARERDAQKEDLHRYSSRHSGRGLLYSQLLEMMKDLEKNPSHFILP